MSEAALESVRLDKWLWAARVYKTRTLATNACRSGDVIVDGKSGVKPSQLVRGGELIHAQIGDRERIVRVAGLLEKRVGPKLVERFLEDLTPEPEPKERSGSLETGPTLVRERGTGRPTKRERREIDRFFG